MLQDYLLINRMKNEEIGFQIFLKMIKFLNVELSSPFLESLPFLEVPEELILSDCVELVSFLDPLS